MIYKIRPWILKDFFGFFYKKYGIDENEEIYARKSLLGFGFGESSRAHIKKIVGRRPSGSWWGDIEFETESHGVIKWENVFSS